jgi:hypothetical protein
MLCSKKKAPEISGFKSTLPEAISSIARAWIFAQRTVSICACFMHAATTSKATGGSVGMPITTRQPPGRTKARSRGAISAFDAPSFRWRTARRGRLGEVDVVRQLVGEGFRMNDISRRAAMHGRRRPEGDAGVDVLKAHASGARGHVRNAHRSRGRLGLRNRNRVRTRTLGERLRWRRTSPFLSEALRCERRLRT